MAAENLGGIFTATTAPRLNHHASVTAVSGVGPVYAPGPTPPSTSATTYDHGLGHSQSISFASELSPDPAIRALLDQQAEIEAKLAALLPRKYGPNIRLELNMLRHKLRALKAFASEHSKHLDPFFIRQISMVVNASPC